eukprot:1642753-Amphidinium_carterae.1
MAGLEEQTKLLAEASSRHFGSDFCVSLCSPGGASSLPTCPPHHPRPLTFGVVIPPTYYNPQNPK